MKKTPRSPKKLAIDKTKLRVVVDEQLTDVTGGREYNRDLRHHAKFKY